MMRVVVRIAAVVTAGFLLAQCGKKGGTETTGLLPYGTSVELQPVNLPPPPAGSVYQAWVLRLQKSGTNYSLQYFPYARFGWNSYKYKFTNETTGTDLGYVFKASPDTGNLFSQNLTGFMRADTIGLTLEKLLRGQSVPLPGESENISKLLGFLLTIEPAGETGPDLTAPAVPFLVAYSNDTGKTELIYPSNYRHPDFNITFFLATPTDTLFEVDRQVDTNHIQNEHRGVWFGFIDTSRYDLGIRMVRPDTVLRKLARELLPGWQFEGWIERNGSRVSTGHFRRGDSADLENPYAYFPDSAFALPGEDFLVNNPPAEFAGTVRGLLQSTVMVTLEPLPDNDPAMFPVILFRATAPAVDSSIRDPLIGIENNLHFNFEMENRARFFPKVRVRVIPEER